MPDANDASGFFINCIHFFTMESVTSLNPDEHFPYYIQEQYLLTIIILQHVVLRTSSTILTKS
jgi:hypothetical protein